MIRSYTEERLRLMRLLIAWPTFALSWQNRVISVTTQAQQIVQFNFVTTIVSGNPVKANPADISIKEALINQKHGASLAPFLPCHLAFQY